MRLWISITIAWFIMAYLLLALVSGSLFPWTWAEPYRNGLAGSTLVVSAFVGIVIGIHHASKGM